MPKAERCIYCGGLPLTREDILPKWLDKYYGPAKPGGLFKRVPMEPNHPGPTRRYPKMRLVENLACKPCNTGWMSGIDREIQDTLAPMIFTGPLHHLSAHQCAQIAAWVTKFSMSIEWKAYTRPAYFTDTERTEFARLKHPQHPPDGTTVWIVPVDSNMAMFHPTGHDLRFPPYPPFHRPVVGISYTFNLFFLGFQLVHLRVGKLPKCSDRRWEATTFQVWPIRPAQRWPPAKRIDELQLQPFADRWKNTELVMKGAPPLPDDRRAHLFLPPTGE